MLGSIYKKHGPIRIGITQGELSGISPEIINKTLQELEKDKTLEIVVIASQEGLAQIHDYSKKQFGRHIEFIKPVYDDIPEKISQSDVLASIYYGAKLAESGKIDALVTAPIDKNKVAKKYPAFSGHTGFLRQIFNTKSVLMLMSNPSLKIGILTEHIPLSTVHNNINKERIIEAVLLLNEHLAKSCHAPCIGVLALNPHSGDAGLVGTEEINIILPAIKKLKEMGINVIGPIPADSAFVSPTKDKCDGILAMYHDQGMIPAKIRGYDSLVNISLGLPIIRTSPGHGVAYDIVGQNKASASSMIKAVSTAIDMVLSERI